MAEDVIAPWAVRAHSNQCNKLMAANMTPPAISLSAPRLQHRWSLHPIRKGPQEPAPRRTSVDELAQRREGTTPPPGAAHPDSGRGVYNGCGTSGPPLSSKPLELPHLLAEAAA
ncbi:MAG: hypothetical protein SGPRY_003298 [Prymnesium sp.]